ncbi:MAG: tyrosine/phenylalanine carboxypeptidase domain-containing protein [Methylococcaceae bacterium]
MTKTIEKEKERIRKVAHLLYDGARPVLIIRFIDWPASVKQGFFAKGAKELPEIRYPGFDAKPTIDIIREARRMIIPVSPIDLWLERQANSIETGARMLAGVGTPVFFENSRQVYGEPTASLR